MNNKLVKNIVGKCFNCEKELNEGEMFYYTEDDNLICENCYNELGYSICEICGKAVDSYSQNWVENDEIIICNNCLENSTNYKICNDCGRIFNINNEGIETNSGDCYCDNCCGDYYECVECGEIYHIDEMYENDNGDYVCNNCYEEDLLHDYNYKPEIEVTRTNEETEDESLLYCGFELETERANSSYSRKEFCKILDEEINKKMGRDFLYFKEDGSLDNGVEIVSHPFTIDFFIKNQELFENIVKTASNLGYKSHDTTTCGLHIHINRKYFGENFEEQENNIEKLILFFEYFKENIQKFSRRTDFHYCHFLSDNNLGDKEKFCNLKYIKNNKSDDRYVAVNVRNSNTVEIRIFKGTLNAKTFLSSIQFVFNLAKLIKNNEISKITWSKAINLENEKLLKEYCKIRGIVGSKEILKDFSLKEALLKKKKNQKIIKYLLNEGKKELESAIDNISYVEKFFNDYKKGEYFNESKNDKLRRFYESKIYAYSSLSIILNIKKENLYLDNSISQICRFLEGIQYSLNNINFMQNPEFKESFLKIQKILKKIEKLRRF